MGGSYEANLEGNSIWITGMKGMRKETAKYNVLQYVRATSPSMNPANKIIVSPSQSTEPVTPQSGIYTWQVYQALGAADKQTVHNFCTQNPQSTALVPKDSPIHALQCAAWLSALSKTVTISK
jgi:hypothetical protein